MDVLFYLKKLIGGMLMPIPLTLIMLVLSFLLLKARPVFARSLLFIAIVFLSATSFMPVADSLMQPLESSYQAFDVSNQKVDVVVVLGSCHRSDSNLPPAAQLCGAGLFRLTEAIRILNANPDAALFVSGYKLHDSRSHAEVLYEVAQSLGVNKQRIHRFDTPKDTEEEAKAMAPRLSGKQVALVSSASHLPRAVTFFKRQGINVIPAVANKTSSVGFNGISAQAQIKSERVFYEYLGQAFQWIKGL